jgi:hypothetical protein
MMNLAKQINLKIDSLSNSDESKDSDFNKESSDGDEIITENEFKAMFKELKMRIDHEGKPL